MFEEFFYIPLFVILTTTISQVLYLKKSIQKSESNNPKTVLYSYRAKTISHTLDHRYRFSIESINGEYRCYILSRPKYRTGNVSRYNPHCWIESGSERRYICWTGKIENISQAKALCRLWSDKTQQFVDTGKPAPGFER